jgi:hypothetical protein
MKKSSLLLLMGCLLALSASTQTKSGGYYLTSTDYLAGKICYPHTVKGRSKISDGDLLTGRHLVIDRDGSACHVDQNKVYAVRCSDGTIIRMYEHGCYTLLDPGEAVLLYKVTIYPAGKGDQLRVRYFFSKDAAGGIEDLTLDNLKQVFRENRKFEDALNTQFPNDNDLYAYDKVHKCYKLSRVYDTLN